MQSEQFAAQMVFANMEKNIYREREIRGVTIWENDAGKI